MEYRMHYKSTSSELMAMKYSEYGCKRINNNYYSEVG